MGHIVLLVVAIGFAVLAAVSGTEVVRERMTAGPTPKGDPPPPAGTPRDRLNKWAVTAAVAAVLCAVSFLGIAYGR